ncbi:ABC transporter substrate-binding protein, partial [Butyricicoccus sp. 1XD8-22]
MKKSWLLFLSLITAVLLVVACSNDASTDTGTSSANTKKEGPFVYVAQQVVGSIDPAKHTDETELIAILNTYDPLVYPKIEEGVMDPGPHLATDWTVSEDGKTYTVNLRDDVIFQSGNKFTANDVVYSIQRMIAIQQGFSWLWQGVLEPENVKAISDTQVEFTLNNAYAPFVSTLTQLFIVDSELLKENSIDGNFGEFGDYGQAYIEDNVAGSGPYKLTEWNRGSHLNFSKNESYWKGWKEGQLEEVQMKIVTEQATVKTMLNSGDADMVHQWLTVDAYEEFKKASGIVVEEDASVQLQ